MEAPHRFDRKHNPPSTYYANYLLTTNTFYIKHLYCYYHLLSSSPPLKTDLIYECITRDRKESRLKVGCVAEAGRMAGRWLEGILFK
jgi:hypothetical protein